MNGRILWIAEPNIEAECTGKIWWNPISFSSTPAKNTQKTRGGEINHGRVGERQEEKGKDAFAVGGRVGRKGDLGKKN